MATVSGKLNHILNRFGDFCWNEAVPMGGQLHLSSELGPPHSHSYCPSAGILVAECTFESDNCKLCKIINFQLTINGPHRALLFRPFLAAHWRLSLSSAASRQRHYDHCGDASWMQVQVLVQVLAGPAASCNARLGPTELDTHRNRTKETARRRATERAAARIQAQADPKQKMSNFVIYYPNPVSVSDSLGVSLQQRHTRGHSAFRVAERGREKSFVTHCVWICGPVPHSGI